MLHQLHRANPNLNHRATPHSRTQTRPPRGRALHSTQGGLRYTVLNRMIGGPMIAGQLPRAGPLLPLPAARSLAVLRRCLRVPLEQLHCPRSRRLLAYHPAPCTLPQLAVPHLQTGWGSKFSSIVQALQLQLLMAPPSPLYSTARCWNGDFRGSSDSHGYPVRLLTAPFQTVLAAIPSHWTLAAPSEAGLEGPDYQALGTSPGAPLGSRVPCGVEGR